MARSHARIHVAIWRDQEWLDLSPMAKLVYVTILSQPRLSLVGVIDFAPGRWSSQIGVDRATFEHALEELEDERFVIVDTTTDELLVRTFVTHDLDPNRINSNLARGFWGAWGCVASAYLRSEVIHETPDAQWAKLEPAAPPDAVQTRRSARLEPSEPPRSQPKEPARSQPPSPSPTPVTSSQPGPADPVEPAVTAQDRQTRFAAAALIIGERAAARATTENPGAVRCAVAAAVQKDRYADAYNHLAAYPTTTAEELAEFLEPTGPKPRPEQPNPSRHLRPVTEVLADRPDADMDMNLEAIRAIKAERIAKSAGGAHA